MLNCSTFVVLITLVIVLLSFGSMLESRISSFVYRWSRGASGGVEKNSLVWIWTYWRFFHDLDSRWGVRTWCHWFLIGYSCYGISWLYLNGLCLLSLGKLCLFVWNKSVLIQVKPRFAESRGVGHSQPLKSVGVPLPQIYGLIGPPKSA